MVRHHWLTLAGALLVAALCTNAQAQNLTLLTEELPPLNYTEAGQIKGLSVAIVREILKRVDEPDTIQVVPWARGYKSALEEPNVALFSTARSEEREPLFKWVGPLVRWSYVFYKRRGSPIVLNSLDDARRVGSIATYRDDAREQFLREQGFTNLDSSPKLVSCARKLLEGRVDLWLDSNLSANQVVRQLGEDPRKIEPVLGVKTSYLYVAFSQKTDDAVVARWQQALEALYREGVLRRIYAEWLPDEQPPPIPTADSGAIPAALAKLRLLTEELPPWNFTQNGHLTGYGTEVVGEIMRRLNLTKTIEVMPWSRAYALAASTPNVALFSTVRSEQRENLFWWVGPIGSNRTVLYARSDYAGDVRTLDDARSMESIGTYKDDVDEQYLRDLGFSNLYSHGTPGGAVRNLIAGRIQGWVAGDMYARPLLQRLGYTSADIRPLLTLRNADIYIAFSRSTPEGVVELWQKTLDDMDREGLISAYQARWLHDGGQD